MLLNDLISDLAVVYDMKDQTKRSLIDLCICNDPQIIGNFC